MATDAILGWLGSFIGWLIGLLQVPDVPAWMSDAAGYASTVGGYVADTGSWIPWPLVQGVLLTWAVVFVAGLAIKLIRIVASFLTLGGGSAA